MKVVQRLEFENIFPNEEKKTTIEYLAEVPKKVLLKTVGYFNTRPLPNFDRFFSNREIHADIFNRVVEYCKKRGVKEKPVLMSPHACLKLSEIILSNKATLLEGNNHVAVDKGEMNVFKAFLVVNRELNKNQSIDNLSESNHEKLVDCSILFTFPTSDLALFDDNDNIEFLKLMFTTLVKVEYLFDFLNSKPEYESLRKGLISSFNTDNQDEFFREMKFLFYNLLELKRKNGYIFTVDNEKSKAFLKSMISNDIGADEDFTYLKIHPLYKIEEHTYSIVNFFYVIDKFYRSAKFKIKEIYEADKTLKPSYGDFFSFFNKEFSENFLMKRILDDIYHKSYFVKKPETVEELDGEPDYYLRHGNCIFVFENKDVMIAKKIKASADIEMINGALRQKFLGDANYSVGIGQLINTIEEILSKKFRFDDYVNKKNNLKIYPILVVHDRIFQTPGINYRLNTWYKENIANRLGERFNLSNFMDLTIIDIDTLILWLPYLKAKDRNFRDIVDNHLSKQGRTYKINTADIDYGMVLANKHLTSQVMPIAHREIPYEPSWDLLVDKFRDVVSSSND